MIREAGSVGGSDATLETLESDGMVSRENILSSTLMADSGERSCVWSTTQDNHYEQPNLLVGGYHERMYLKCPNKILSSKMCPSPVISTHTSSISRVHRRGLVRQRCVGFALTTAVSELRCSRPARDDRARLQLLYHHRCASYSRRDPSTFA